jgi:hypothetical protein
MRAGSDCLRVRAALLLRLLAGICCLANCLPPAVAQSAALPASPRATAYVDRLIDGGTGEDPPDTYRVPEVDRSPGRRSLVWTSSFERSESAARAVNEVTTELSYRRETERLGEWRLEGAWRGMGERRNHRATLYVSDVALTAEHRLDAALGLVRTPLDARAALAYRLNVPSTLTHGITGLLLSGTRRIDVSVGEVARVDGGRVGTHGRQARARVVACR